MPYAATFKGTTKLSRDTVYARLADFGGLKAYFADAIESVSLEGVGIGSKRAIRMKGKDGVIIERLEALVDRLLISYSIINESPLPLDHYHSVRGRFRTWCAVRGVSALPATVESVAAFLACEVEKGIRSSTIGRRVAAIRIHSPLSGHVARLCSGCREIQGSRRSGAAVAGSMLDPKEPAQP
jgi:hypothetical protein